MKRWRGVREIRENRESRENREDAELTRASLRLAVQFTALVVVLLGVAGGLVYGLVAAQTRDAAENTLSSATQFDSPREAPLDVFLAVYDDGRLAVSRNMPSGLPYEEALADVAETGQARRDTVTAGDRTYEVLTARRGRDVVQAAVDTRESADQLRRLAFALVISVVIAGLLAGAVSALAARAAMRPMAEALALQRRFVADASHELRTPLTLLSTRVQMLRRRLMADAGGSGSKREADGGGGEAPEAVGSEVLNSDAVRAADDVIADTKVLTGILEDLLMAADPRQTGATEPVNLVNLARSAVRALQPEANSRDLSLELDLPDTDVIVLGGEIALHRIFTALGANALDYARSAVGVSVRRSGPEAVIRVSDDGPGFPPGFSTPAFERFASTRHRADSEQTRTPDGLPESRHYGLGLALVAEIVARCGGSIRALPNAAPGGGGAVEVRLPLARSEP
jgi:two-component system OmpR family sensor kinase